jgi:hypothetical protein
MMCRVIIVVILLLIFLPGCDHGLEPPKENVRTAISGIISYQNWPPPDSLLDLRLVAFKEYPPTNIFFEVTSGRAIVYPPILNEGLPLNVTDYTYIMDLPAGEYAYLVVAQQYGINITSDWRAVGQYDTTGTGLDSIPTTIMLKENRVLDSINIRVDFHNLPYQPFVQ